MGEENKKNILPVKSDVIFRLFFADERNVEFLISFLQSALDLPADDYDEIEIADPHLLREYPGDKLGIIDVKLRTKTKKIIHIEIQLSVTPELKNRIVFYEAKLITEQIGSGDSYAAVNRVVSIVIADGKLIKDKDKENPCYHHRFTLYDRVADVEFTDLLEVHTLELMKLPPAADGTALYDWAKFIAANSEEELKVIAERNQTVSRAVVKLRELSADERARDLYERREKERRDTAMFLRDAETSKAFAIAKNMLKRGRHIDEVMEDTGLTREEVEGLR
ncbi:MAG: Rpn family recombination-promoting nuclease/putative transposase [Gracilibacteraceae bacterium]|jgi:predicted transposase/invertase (TIGR01784 family)|nr:Rpn family recombination-promoting nuclease/putative transposase [Gracilibacteraceae bacterium]